MHTSYASCVPAIVFRDKKGGAGTDNLQDDMPVDEEENTNSATHTQGKDETISELGALVFKSEVCIEGPFRCNLIISLCKETFPRYCISPNERLSAHNFNR